MQRDDRFRAARFRNEGSTSPPCSGAPVRRWQGDALEYLGAVLQAVRIRFRPAPSASNAPPRSGRLALLPQLLHCVLLSLMLVPSPLCLGQQGRAVGTAHEAARPSTQQNPDRTDLALELLFDTGLVDTSAAGHKCRSHGDVTFVDGKFGQCGSFDGASWIDTGLSQDELGAEFTVECWVNPAPQQSSHADIFGNHVSAGEGFVLQQDGGNTNEFLAAYGVGSGKWVTTEPVLLAPGRWQHVALVRTRSDLRFYLNGVLVISQPSSASPAVSPMPVAVGLGYTTPQRCYRGLVDSFRIWKKALTAFPHAGIDPSAASETSAQYLGSTERRPAAAVAKSWSLATDNTHLTLGVTAEGQLVVSELSAPRVGWNWITRPTTFSLPSHVWVGTQSQPTRWKLVDAHMQQHDVQRDVGQTLTLRWACEDPSLEAESVWQANPGPGPIHHSMQIRNRSQRSVILPDQATFDLDLAGATALWSFHSDGGTPDAQGVYCQSLMDEETPESGPLRYTIRTAPSGEFIPYVVFDAGGQHGVYMGLEWSYCRIEVARLTGGQSPVVRVRGGEFAGRRFTLAAGESFEVRPGFIGTYAGDLDDAGNGLRRWWYRTGMPEILRQDAGYPKVQWNAFGATGKSPGSWDPVESKYYPLIDDIAPLGFEEVMIDVAWWQGNEPDSDQSDWPSGMRKAAEYAHQKGMRFGLYWTDDQDMASPGGRRQRADRVSRLFHQYHADMWRSDSTRGEVIGASYASTRGFYQMVDMLSQKIPGFQWENCSGGGRIKDFGAMRRAVKIFNSDTYSPLHVRQAFYDSSYVLHPIQIEGHLGSTDGRYRPHGVAGVRYAFRSTSMGAPEWFLDAPNGGNGTEPWTREERAALKECVATYKTRIRPLVREANLYHILARPDGRRRDAVEYYNPGTGEGVMYLFQPSEDSGRDPIHFKGLDSTQQYELAFQDGTHPAVVKSGAELMDSGVTVTLPGREMSELIFIHVVRDTRQ